jgi:hypothetical protein
MPALEGKKTNSSPLPIAATIALEMIGPIARTLIKRSQPTSRRARTSIFRSAHRGGASPLPGPRDAQHAGRQGRAHVFQGTKE